MTTLNPHDKAYADLVSRILMRGIHKEDRTGTGTYSLFGEKLEFDMRDGFPLLTLKYTPFRLIAEELFWFIAGGRVDHKGWPIGMNEKDLAIRDVNIWQPWSGEDGDLGPVYGYQWRYWPTNDGWNIGYVDQLLDVERRLHRNPDDRRLIVSAWNVADLPSMALPPCHMMFQFFSYVPEDGDVRRLDIQMYQRSCDMFLGVPFNIASYALLLHLMANATGHKPGKLHWVGGDCHVYTNHVDACEEMLVREPMRPPTLTVFPPPKRAPKGDGKPRGWIDHYALGDLDLEGYCYHPKIAAEVSV